jgi:hypothetical protein
MSSYILGGILNYFSSKMITEEVTRFKLELEIEFVNSQES